MDLAIKLILLQFDAVFDIYSQWLSDEHAKLTPQDKNIRFETTIEKRMIVLKFIVNVNGLEVVFISKCMGGSFTTAQIDLNGRIATYGQLADILSDITYEMYYQLELYAKRNNFPPENIMH